MRLWIIPLLAALSAPAADLRVGAAAVKITPPKGAPMAGYYYNRAADGVHDDLYAKALVLASSGEKAALVACDLSGIPRNIIDEARKLIEASTGIAGGQVMISATHTHTGPVVLGGPNRYIMPGEMLEIAQRYAADLPARIAESVRLANAGLKPARAFAATGQEPSLTFNRRYYMKDGTVGWNPGKLNPNIVRPAGPIDPAVPVVYFEASDNKPIATYVNYALHLDTVGGMEYSADYAYTLARLLGEAKGKDMLTVFTIGCAGNLNHIDVSTRAPQQGHGEAARIGTILAGEVLKTMKRLQAVEGGALRVRSQMLHLPLPEIRPGDLELSRKVTATFGQPNAAPFMDLVRAFKIQDVAERRGEPLEAEVQVITVGSQLCWVGLPGEIFTELGMAIKNASPFQYTNIAELANGSIGYVPNRKAYPEGAYESESARCGAGSGEMLVDAATRLLVALRNEKAAN
jgi:hypothetical protein